MKLNFRKTIAALAVGSVALVGLTGVAGATDPIANSGQDGINDIFTSGGSDTTYVVESDISQLYNRAPGCNTDNALGSPTLGRCITTNNQAQTGDVNDNWDHDVNAQIYPTGSGAGISVVGSTYDIARSSRNANASELANNNGWGFAKDGIAVVTPPGRATTTISKAQLIGIFNCTITQWSAITGDLSDTATIVPYGVNGSSGTYGSFKSYLGIDPNGGACVNKLGTGATAYFAFENDFKPVLADAATKGLNPSDILSWGSFAELKTYPYKASGVSFWNVEGVAPGTGTIANNSYPIYRNVYRITAKTSVSLTGSNGANAILSTTGATNGKAGAVRRYVEWTCQPLSYFGSSAAPNAATSVNPYTGSSYYEDITSVINKSGFQRIPSTQRTAGACAYNV